MPPMIPGPGQMPGGSLPQGSPVGESRLPTSMAMPTPGPPSQPPALAPPNIGLQPPQKWHDIKVRRKKRVERCVIAPVPPEEFGITRFARNINDTGYCFHEVVKRDADLVEQGYDERQVRNINTYSAMTNQEELARDTVEERQGQTGDGGLNRANRQVKITEHYIKLDYNRDGKPRMYRITTGGDPSQLLIRNGVEDIVAIDGPPPFAAITPVPMPHRFFGRSIADLVMEIQKIKTVLMRGLLDNLYSRNSPRYEVPESHASSTTVADMLTRRPEGIVRTKQPGGVVPLEVPDVTTSIYPALQYMDTQREWKTGMTRQGQGVDPNSLQNQVATIANQMQDASQAKVKLIARIFAETGIRDLFGLVHSTIRRNGSKPQTIKLRGKWVTIDPREWKARDNMTINVGLGPGDPAMQLAKLQVLIQSQVQAVQVGIVSYRNLYNSAKELTKLARPGADVDTFFTDPSTPPNPNDPASRIVPPPPNPNDKSQVTPDIQHRMALEQQKAQGEMATTQMRMALEDKQAQAAISSEATKQQNEMAIAQQNFQMKRELALMEHELKSREMDQQLAHRQYEHELRMQQLREQHVSKMAQMAAKPAQSETVQ